MKTAKIWRPDLGRYVEVDAAVVEKIKAASKIKNARNLLHKESAQTFFQRVNIIDLAFRLFFFFGIVCPCVGIVIYGFVQSVGTQTSLQVLALLGVLVGIMFVLVVLCYLSQLPANELSLGLTVGTFIKAIVMTPIALIGSFFVAKAPKGTVGAGGIVSDMINDAGEIIDKVKHR